MTVLDPCPFHLRGVWLDGQGGVTAEFRHRDEALEQIARGQLLVSVLDGRNIGATTWQVDEGLHRLTATMTAIDRNDRPQIVKATVPIWHGTGPTIDLDDRPLQLQVDAAPDGATLVGGSFAGPVDLSDRHGLTFRGVHVDALDGRGWRLRDCSSITFDGCSVRGSRIIEDGGYSPSGHAWAVEGSHRVRIVDCAAYGMWGDWVYVGSTIGKFGHGLFHNTPSHDVTVERCDFSVAGRQGIAVTSAVDLTVQDCTLGHVNRTLLDVEPGHVFDPVERVTFQRLQLTGNVRNNLLAMHGSAYRIQDVVLSDVDCGVHSPIRVSVTGNAERGGLTIADVTSDRLLANPHAAVQVAGWEDVTVVRCRGVMDSRRQSPFVDAQNCWRVTVEDVDTRDERTGPGDKQARGHTVDLLLAWWEGHRSDGPPFRVVEVDRGERKVVTGDPEQADPRWRPGTEPHEPEPEPDPPGEPQPDPEPQPEPQPDPEPEPQPDPEPVPLPWWLRWWRAILRWLGID